MTASIPKEGASPHVSGSQPEHASTGGSSSTSCHNASTPPPPRPPDLADLMLAADPVFAQAAGLARVITPAHHDSTATSVRIHGIRAQGDRPLRIAAEELRAHPEWRNFGDEVDDHPPMRGWLATPLIGSDGENYGFIQASDRLDGDFMEQDEANLVRQATLTATALDALAQLQLPEAPREDRRTGRQER